MDIEPRYWALIAGFLLGLIAGFAARAAAFCTLGAIADAVVGQRHRRLRAWALALAVALLGSQALHQLGVVDLGRSIYLAQPFNAVMAVAGGGLFGVGMALVGTCGFGTLIRLGGGDLRALIDMACLGLFCVHHAFGTARLSSDLCRRGHRPHPPGSFIPRPCRTRQPHHC